MACKLKCPNCEAMLKEEGDESKVSNGTYRVFDAAIRFYKDEGKPNRLIWCSECWLCFEPIEGERL